MIKNRFFSILLLIILFLSLVPSAYATNGKEDIISLASSKYQENFDYNNDSSSIPGIDEQNEKYTAKIQGNFWTNFLIKYRLFIIGISSAASLIFLIIFIINFSKLGWTSCNPQMRQQTIRRIIWSGIACAITGGIAIFFRFFYNA